MTPTGAEENQFQPQQNIPLEESVQSDSAEIIYITEIDGEFVTVNYNSHQQEPQIVPLADTPELTNQTAFEKTQLFPNQSKSFSGKKGLAVGMVTGILLTILGMRFFSPSQSNSVSVSTNVVKSVVPPQSVTAQAVTIAPVERTLEASGTVAAFELIPVMAQETGLPIKEIWADRGNLVQQGQILAKLDDSRLQAELVQAQANVAQAEAKLAELKAGNRPEEISMARERVKNAQASVTQAESDLDLTRKRVERNKTLQTEGAIAQDRLDEILNQERIRESSLAQAQASLREAQQELTQLQAGARPEEIQQAQAELAQAQGQLQLIEAQLEDTAIPAPVSGKIATRTAKIGDLTASAALFEIIENGRLELRLNVPETLIGQINPGQNVQITADQNPNWQFSGKVREIDPVIDGDSRQAIVKVDLPDEIEVKPGMFLQAKITTKTTTGKTVPMKALIPQSDGKTMTAFVLQPDNTVKAQIVEIGEILPSERVEVLNGLKSGDRIVVKGAAYLKDGDRVQVIGETIKQ